MPNENDRAMSARSPTRPCRIPQRLGSARPKTPANMPAVTADVQTPRSVRSQSRSRSRSDTTDSVKQPVSRARTERLQPAVPIRVSKHPRLESCDWSRSDATIASVKQPVSRARAVRLQPAVQTRKKLPVCKKTFNSMTSKLLYNSKNRQLMGILHAQENKNNREHENIENGNQDVRGVPDAKKIQLAWKKHLGQFEVLKRDLDVQQKNVLDLYSALTNTHKAMIALGQEASLPSIEDLKIMNVARMSADQLLQLCSEQRDFEDMTRSPKVAPIDMNKVLEMPTKLVATCEMTLHKRMEIIEWFQTLKSEEKGISMNKLTKKVNEFIAENEMLTNALSNSRADFMKDLKNIIESFRKSVNETTILQVRTENMIEEIAELNSQNTDLRSKLQNLENTRLTPNKQKLEEIEKELKEERCKKMVIKDRLKRAEQQTKTLSQRAAELESALDLTRTQNWTLERTVQQLNQQNQKLQLDFDKELIKLTNSIKDNTVHLEEIAEARERLQAEKETLEKRLEELSETYNESLNKLKDELSVNVKKLQDTEKKFDEETNERKKLESNLQSLCAQLFEAEIRYKEGLQQMRAKDEELSKHTQVKCELDEKTKDLEAVKRELDDYKEKMSKQTETIKEIENKFQETINLDKSLKMELRNKEKYIADLEKSQSLLRDQLREGERKMELYEKQLDTLKIELTQIQEEFGEVENITQLHEMVHQQREKLLETTSQNEELAKALQQKDLELENCLEQLAEQQQLLEQKDDVIKMITEREEEQANITKLLRNNLELRAKADAELNQQLNDKNAEIDSLTTHVETRKQQISQLEQIILTLEDQIRKINLQRRRDRDKLTLLENALLEFEAIPETKNTVDTPVKNLDNLIKTLEDELNAFDHDHIQNKPSWTKKPNDERKKEVIEHCADGGHNYFMHVIEKAKPGRPKSPKKCSQNNHDKDNLGRKKAITNMETQKWLDNTQPINMMYSNFENKIPPLKGVHVIAGQLDDKKGKMLKLAGHHL